MRWSLCTHSCDTRGEVLTLCICCSMCFAAALSMEHCNSELRLALCLHQAGHHLKMLISIKIAVSGVHSGQSCTVCMFRHAPDQCTAQNIPLSTAPRAFTSHVFMHSSGSCCTDTPAYVPVHSGQGHSRHRQGGPSDKLLHAGAHMGAAATRIPQIN